MNKKVLFGFFSFIILLFNFYNLMCDQYHIYLVSVLLLLFNLLSMYMFRNSKKMFFLCLMLFYFNYSFIICKYNYFGNSFLLSGLYHQLINSSYFGKSINLVSIFNILSVFGVLKFINDDENFLTYDLNFKSLKVKYKFSLFLKLIILFVLVYHLVGGITYNTTLFEYLYIVFIFAFLNSKNNKKDKLFFEIMMVLCSIYSLYIGERIAVLQFLISDFIINYIENISAKKIVLTTIIGVAFFTVAGIYGDVIDSENPTDFSRMSTYNVVSALSDRRFALDTSVSSYFSNLSIMSTGDKFLISERIKDFFTFSIKYTILGSKSNYVQPSDVAKKYYINYGGGFITGYFYYWFGYFGIIILSIYVSFLYRIIMKTNNISGNYKKCISIYIISSFPRWYLYFPSSLFRGIFIFTSIYYIVTIISKIEVK